MAIKSFPHFFFLSLTITARAPQGTKTSTTWPPKNNSNRMQHTKKPIENEPKIVNFNWLAKQKLPPPPPPPKLEHSFSGRSCVSWAWLDCGQMPSTGTWPPCWDTCSRSRCWRCSSQATCCSICPDFGEYFFGERKNWGFPPGFPRLGSV